MNGAEESSREASDLREQAGGVSVDDEAGVQLATEVDIIIAMASVLGSTASDVFDPPREASLVLEGFDSLNLLASVRARGRDLCSWISDLSSDTFCSLTSGVAL